MSPYDRSASKYDKCWCDLCKNQRFGRAKYGREHAAGCVCEACTKSYNEHNRKLTCPCADCDLHRTAIYPPAKKRIKKPIRERKTVATVNFCERCNTMGKSSAMGSLQYWTHPNERPKEPMEICPGCVEDFFTWLKGDVVTPRPKSYTEPWEPAKSEDPTASLSTSELAAAFLARQATDSAKELEA